MLKSTIPFHTHKKNTSSTTPEVNRLFRPKTPVMDISHVPDGAMVHSRCNVSNRPSVCPCVCVFGECFGIEFQSWPFAGPTRLPVQWHTYTHVRARQSVACYGNAAHIFFWSHLLPFFPCPCLIDRFRSVPARPVVSPGRKNHTRVVPIRPLGFGWRLDHLFFLSLSFFIRVGRTISPSFPCPRS